MNLVHVLDRYDSDWYVDVEAARCYFGSPDSTVSVAKADLERVLGPLTPEND